MFVTSSGPYANIWVSEAERITDNSCHHLHVVYTVALYSFEHVLIQRTLVVILQILPLVRKESRLAKKIRGIESVC